jgi:hypothetical protein
MLVSSPSQVCINLWQVEGVTDLEIPNLYSLSVWKIKPVRIEKNKFSPICLFNKNNEKDFLSTETYAGFKWKVLSQNTTIFVL